MLLLWRWFEKALTLIRGKISWRMFEVNVQTALLASEAFDGVHRLLDKGVQIGIPSLNLDTVFHGHSILYLASCSGLNNSIISNDSGGNIVVKSTLQSGVYEVHHKRHSGNLSNYICLCHNVLVRVRERVRSVDRR